VREEVPSCHAGPSWSFGKYKKGRREASERETERREENVKLFVCLFIYLQLCHACVKENEEKMKRWDDMKGIEDCVAVVTGARIKIGYPFCFFFSILFPYFLFFSFLFFNKVFFFFF
jgi:hypothetical protein